MQSINARAALCGNYATMLIFLLESQSTPPHSLPKLCRGIIQTSQKEGK